MTLRLLFLLLLSTAALHAQKVVVQSVITDAYPTVSARIYSFDANAQPIPLNPEHDRRVRESVDQGIVTIPDTAVNIFCQLSTNTKAVSAVLACDLSSPASLAIMQDGLRAWVEAMDFSNSECALSAFSDKAYIVQDLNSDKSRLLQRITSLLSLRGTNHKAALLDDFAGALPIISRGRFQKTIVLISDGVSSLSDSLILAEARRLDVTIHVVMIGTGASTALRAIAAGSGGICLENVRTTKDAEYGFRIMAAIARGAEPCVISWEGSRKFCDNYRTVYFDSIPIQTTAVYTVPESMRRRLEITPLVTQFGEVAADSTKDVFINLTARGIRGDILHISAMQMQTINSADTLFSIVGYKPNSPIFLRPDSSLRLQIRFHSKEAIRHIGKLLIESNACNNPAAFFEANSAENANIIPRIIFPEGGTLLAGMDTTIVWQNALPSDTMQLWFSASNGRNPTLISDAATGLKFRWRVPDISTTRGVILIAPLGKTLPKPDTNFNIIRPTLKADTLDMGVVNIGEQKEILLINAISQAKPLGDILVIDSIRIDSPEFEYVSGLPITLVQNGSANLELRFLPMAEGVRQSRLTLYTNNGAVSTDIRGEGVQPRLLLPRLIRMGEMPLGVVLDTTVEKAICLGAATKARIVQADIAFPDVQQFSMDKPFPVDINTSNPCTPLRLEFNPRFRGRTNGRMLLTMDNGERYELVLAGEGICGLPAPDMRVDIPDSVTALIGDTLRLPLRLINSPLSFRTMQRSYSLDLSFNKSILYPLAPLNIGTENEKQRVVSISHEGFMRGDTLMVLPFTTVLGDADFTMLNIKSFRWTDDCSDPTQSDSCKVLLKNVCRVGGTRLFLYSDTLAFTTIAPNPVADEVVVSFDLRERGRTSMTLIDMFGREMLRLFDEEMDKGSYRLRASLGTVPPGQYVAILTTPTKRISTIIGVAR